MRDDFAVFILTHGRPENVITLKTLRRQGYTGKVYLIIDNEDSTADRYFEKFGDIVIQFDKEAISKTFDQGDNFDDRRTITYARNASFEIARSLGLQYWIQFDDDYSIFSLRFNEHHEFEFIKIKSLDKVFEILLRYYESIPALSIAMSQGGDFIGGGDVSNRKVKRKAMNSFICSVDRPFQFVGRFNEDVNTYTTLGNRGGLFLTIPMVMLQQGATQGTAGGITELYKKFGTYVKGFCSVMYSPSSVKVSMMQSEHPRIHHAVSWVNTVPAIIREDVKKERNVNKAKETPEIV